MQCREWMSNHEKDRKQLSMEQANLVDARLSVARGEGESTFKHHGSG